MPVDRALMSVLSKRPDSTRAYESTSEPDTFEGTRDGDDTAESDPEVSDGHHAAAKEMMQAHAEGDHEGYAKALHGFISLCK